MINKNSINLNINKNNNKKSINKKAKSKIEKYLTEFKIENKTNNISKKKTYNKKPTDVNKVSKKDRLREIINTKRSNPVTILKKPTNENKPNVLPANSGVQHVTKPISSYLSEFTVNFPQKEIVTTNKSLEYNLGNNKAKFKNDNPINEYLSTFKPKEKNSENSYKMTINKNDSDFELLSKDFWKDFTFNEDLDEKDCSSKDFSFLEFLTEDPSNDEFIKLCETDLFV